MKWHRRNLPQSCPLRTVEEIHSSLSSNTGNALLYYILVLYISTTLKHSSDNASTWPN